MNCVSHALKRLKSSSLLIFLIVIFFSTPALASKIYWVTFDNSSGDDKVQRSNLDGSNVETIVTITGNNQMWGVAVDKLNSKVYWSQYTGGSNYVKRSNLDGSNVETFLTLGSEQVQGLAVSNSNNKLYISSVSNSVIRSADLADGGNYGSVSNTNATQPTAVTVDTLNDKLYWASSNQTSGPSIFRADLDGSNKETLNEKAYTTYSLFVDNDGGKLYWSQLNSYNNPEEYEKVFRANLSDFPITSSTADQYDTGDTYPTNTKEELLIDDQVFANEPSEVRVDYFGDKIYVATGGGSKIVTTALDGSNKTTLINVGSYTYGMDVVIDNTRQLVEGSDINLGNSVTINFADITGDGETTATADPGSANSFLSDIVDGMITDSIFNIATTASFNGGAGFDVTLTYLQADYLSDIAPLGYSEDQLKIFHYNGSTVEEGLVLSRNTTTNTITARFTSSSLSPFGIGVNPEPATLLLLSSALLGLFPFRKTSSAKVL